MNEAERRQALLWAERQGIIDLTSSNSEMKIFLDELKNESGFGELTVAQALQVNVEQCLEIVLRPKSIITFSVEQYAPVGSARFRPVRQPDASELFLDKPCRSRGLFPRHKACP